MGWFSKSTNEEGTGADAQVLRDALVLLLNHIEGELPRSEAKRIRELTERLVSFPVPTGLQRQAQAAIKAMRSTAAGSGSADFADAARSLVGAMQRVSIHDKELTHAISKLEQTLPLRIRNGDARLIDLSAKEIDKSAQAARFRQAQADESVLALIAALESTLGQALEVTADLGREIGAVKVTLEGLNDPATFAQSKEAVMLAIQRVEVAAGKSRSRIDHGVARVRELNHTVRGQGDDVKSQSVRVCLDSLTQVPDRNGFLDALPIALVEARHTGGLLTCMRVNVDGMARVNEDYHQSSGDDVLRTVALTIVQQLRNEDFVARLGGDDFAALLPEAGTREATTAAKRLGRKVARMVFTHQQQTFKVTVSIGLATWDGKESAESLYARSDRALERAKKNGGGQYWAAQTIQSS